MPQWIALCLIWHTGPGPQPALEVRWGAGRYNAQQFLHARVHAHPGGTLGLPVGATQPTVPLPPMSQFLLCR